MFQPAEGFASSKSVWQQLQIVIVKIANDMFLSKQQKLTILLCIIQQDHQRWRYVTVTLV